MSLPLTKGNLGTSQVALNSKQEDLYGTYHEIAFDQKVMLVLSKDQLVVWSRKPFADEVFTTYKVTDWRRHGNAAGIKAGAWIIAIEGGVGPKGEEQKSELLIYYNGHEGFMRWELAHFSGDTGSYLGTSSPLWARMWQAPAYAKGLPPSTPSTNTVNNPIALLVAAFTRFFEWFQKSL